MPVSRPCSVAVVALGAAALVSCDSHAPVGGIPAKPTYSTDLRSVADCGAGVQVPAARTALTPQAANPPTVVLRAGDAVTVTVAAGDRAGLAGVASAGDHAVLCRLAGGPVGESIFVARVPGYVRLGFVARGARSPALAFVKVTS